MKVFYKFTTQYLKYTNELRVKVSKETMVLRRSVGGNKVIWLYQLS